MKNKHPAGKRRASFFKAFPSPNHPPEHAPFATGSVASMPPLPFCSSPPPENPVLCALVTPLLLHPVPDVPTVDVISWNLRVYTLFGWQLPWLWLLGDIVGIVVSALHACRCFPGGCGHTSSWLIRFSADVHGSSDSARCSFLINSFSTL